MVNSVQGFHQRYQNCVTDTASASLLRTLNNVWPRHAQKLKISDLLFDLKIYSKMIKTRTIKVRCIKNEEILMTTIITTTKTVIITTIIMIIMIIRICNRTKL